MEGATHTIHKPWHRYAMTYYSKRWLDLDMQDLANVHFRHCIYNNTTKDQELVHAKERVIRMYFRSYVHRYAYTRCKLLALRYSAQAAFPGPLCGGSCHPQHMETRLASSFFTHAALIIHLPTPRSLIRASVCVSWQVVRVYTGGGRPKNLKARCIYSTSVPY